MADTAVLITGGASPGAVIASTAGALRPPQRLRLSEWADEHFYLSAESAAEPGRWKTLPYQRGIMDSITDPLVERVSMMKSARVGYTKIIDATVGYYMHQDPCPIMVVQPTVEDAQGYSKEELSPMLRDCPVLGKIMPEAAARDSSNTILHKLFPGGSLSVVGANSGRGFRRVSRKVVIFDEVDGYPASAGDEGDQIKLGIRRTEFYWDRKIVAGSTPLVAGTSRIADMFESGDQRRFYVPCPQCGHMDILVFREKQDGDLADRGHFMKWPEGKPEQAFFVCRLNGCVIEHQQKREMVAKGEWRAAAPFRGHASFHIWAAYSFSPNATWGQLAEEFVEAMKKGAEVLKTFVNTVLGETWQEKGDAPAWRRLYLQREKYPIATVPAGVRILTAGVDVQRDRLVYEVVGWGDDKQSWSIEAAVIPGDTSGEEVWKRLDELLTRTWPFPDGNRVSINRLAIDSGFNTQVVYNWARRYPMSRVIACKGVSTAMVIIGSPSKVDVTVSGKRRGYKVWPVGASIAKGELYGWLRFEAPTTESGLPYQPGFCHFPEYGEDYFKQLTAEHLVRVVKRTGFATLEWQLLPGRENHYLDCRVYARAAAALAGLDYHAAGRAAAPPPPPAEAVPGAPPSRPAPAPAPVAPSPARERWLSGHGDASVGRSSWLSKRR